MRLKIAIQNKEHFEKACIDHGLVCQFHEIEGNDMLVHAYATRPALDDSLESDTFWAYFGMTYKHYQYSELIKGQ